MKIKWRKKEKKSNCLALQARRIQFHVSNVTAKENLALAFPPTKDNFQ